jgi:putative serine protease PepD
MTQTPHDTRNQTSGNAGADPGREPGSAPEQARVATGAHDPWAAPQSPYAAQQPSQPQPSAPQPPEQQSFPQQPSQPQPSAPPSDATGPVWYGQTHELPRTSAFGTVPPAHQGHDTSSQTPAGPPPSFPTRDGAEPAQPAKRRRLTELTTVAVLAALLASGGTYAATQLVDGSQPSSSASTSTLGRGTDKGPVVQADASNPNWTATAAAVSPSVVAITVTSGQGQAEGSGVIIDAKGHILTNNHVVSGAGSGANLTVTLNDGRSFKATVAGTDPSTDLAVITLSNAPSDLKPVAIGNSADLKVGDPVMAVGNPLGLAGTVTTGIVSALDRPVTTQAEDNNQDQNPFGQQQGGSDSTEVVTNAIQTSAAINPGNSGGALVNASGQLVGINSAIASLGSSSGGQSGSIGIGFAIPVNEAKTIAQQLIDNGKAQHSFLGITTRDGTASDGTAQRTGAQVVQVSPGTPAAKAGLKSGDVVIKVDDQATGSSESLVASIRERAVGDKVTLTVIRDGKQMTLSATLAAKPTQ